tara:strand:+ start:28 stop:354 length:327 start_codon:yes stop_codon:yes gene_type:complete
VAVAVLTTTQLVEMVDLVVEVVNLIKGQVLKFNPHKTQVSQIFNNLDLMADKVVNIHLIPLVVEEAEVLAVTVPDQLQPIMVTLSVVLLVLVEQIQFLDHPLYMVEVV